MRMVCAAAAAICLLIAAGCGGGGGVASITIGPAKGRPKLPPRDAVVLAKEDRSLAVALALRPWGEGLDALATIVAPGNTGQDGLKVSFQRGTIVQSARPCGSGCYSARLPASGSRTVTVHVGDRAVTFQLPAHWPAPDAATLVRRATTTFQHLRSVRYREHLASSPSASISTLWSQVSPNRLEYTVAGGADGVIIGTTRWDRTTPNGSWIKSAAQEIAAPTPIWSGELTNAHVLARTKDGYVVSFLNRSVPAWFTIDFDRRLRPRSLEMTAAAHFMHHDYLSFNDPLKIRPPR